MIETRYVNEAIQKDLVKKFDSLCGRHSRWNIWADWIEMSAIAISNAVDLAHREEREKAYLKIKDKYTTSEMQVFSEMLGTVIAALNRNPDQDFLGELFMRLELSNSHAGQFFTPYNVCKVMSALNCGDELKHKIDEKGWISVNDPACGAGAMLVAFANDCVTREINYQQSILFTAQDIDFTVGMMCYIQLSLLGCAGYVVIGDTLANPSTAVDSRGLIPVDNGNVWYTPLYFIDVWSFRRIIAQTITRFGTINSSESKKEQQKKPKEPQKTTSRATIQYVQEPEDDIQNHNFRENEFGQLILF